MCHDVSVEPSLLPLNGELITPSSVNCRDNSRADIYAKGFWGRQQGALFDISVFHSNTPSYCQAQVASLFQCHELEKKREYGDCIRVVDGECFTPLVFSTLDVFPLSCTWWKAWFQLKTFTLFHLQFC